MAFRSSHNPGTRRLQLCGDPEEVAAAYAENVPGYIKHRRYLTSISPKSYEATVEITRVNNLSLGRNSVSHGTVFDVQEQARHIVVSVMEQGAKETIEPGCGGRRRIYTGSDAHVVQAVRNFKSMVSSGSVLRAAVFPEALVKNAVEALTGDPVDGPLVFEPGFHTDRGPGALLGRSIALAFQEIADPETLMFHPAASARIQDLLLTSLVLGARHNWSDRLKKQRSPAAPRQVRLVEDYLAANADRPITAAELAEVAGCSLRALQYAFRKFRHTTPMEMLKAIRLGRAHADLTRPGAAVNVAGIASAWGFSNAGRFSAEYRRIYGRSPSEALRFGGVVEEPRRTGWRAADKA